MIAVPKMIIMKNRNIQNFFELFFNYKNSILAIFYKLMPPKLAQNFYKIDNFFSVIKFISRSTISMSANRLNNTALPSITGFNKINDPKFPIPRIAEPLLITATKFPLLV